jgi:hypothetical protein
MAIQQTLAIFLSKVRTSKNKVLQYDHDIDALSVWKWYVLFLASRLQHLHIHCIERPVTARGERVTPSDLRDHRLSHKFLGPCCMCPLLTEGGSTFKEAAIFAMPSGCFVGEYVAECADGKCGYFGK